VVNELRARQVRNFLVTLFCSQGVPMLLAGDEMSRTQQGNNNAYCQDNEMSWVDWEEAGKQQDLIDFTCALSELRRAHPVFRRRRFFSGQAEAPGGQHAGLQDIVWLTPAGRQMTDGDWQAGYARSLAVFLNGDAITEPDPRGDPVRDQSFLLLFNAHRGPVTFTVPDSRFGAAWEVLVNTAAAAGAAATAAGAGAGVRAGRRLELAGRSIMVLRGEDQPEGR
jgi:glycogen operon protein